MGGSRRPCPPHFRERSSPARSARGSALTCTGGEHAPFETALLLLLPSRARGRRFGRDHGLPCPWSRLVSQSLLLDALPRLRPGTRRTPPIASCIQRLRLDANAVDRSAARPMEKRRGPRPSARARGCPERQSRTCCRRPAPVGGLIQPRPGVGLRELSHNTVAHPDSRTPKDPCRACRPLGSISVVH